MDSSSLGYIVDFLGGVFIIFTLILRSRKEIKVEGETLWDGNPMVYEAQLKASRDGWVGTILLFVGMLFHLMHFEVMLLRGVAGVILLIAVLIALRYFSQEYIENEVRKRYTHYDLVKENMKKGVYDTPVETNETISLPPVPQPNNKLDNLKIFFKIILLLALFIPPLLLVGYWYKIEKNTFHPFNGMGISALGDSTFTEENIKEIQEATAALYEETKNQYPSKVGGMQPTSQQTDFQKKVSESITEKLGVFSLLPYHTACLTNHNKIYIDGALDDNQAPNMGGLAIKQADGFELYAPRESTNCKYVQIGSFRESSTTLEIGHPMMYGVTPEEEIKRLRGEVYNTFFIPMVIDRAETRIVVALSWWVIALGYLFLLFAWSFVFFQLEKIMKYSISNLKKP
jgi:hypothetical protein